MIALLCINFLSKAIQILQDIRDKLKNSQDGQLKHVREKIIALYPWYESYETRRKQEIVNRLFNSHEISKTDFDVYDKSLKQEFLNEFFDKIYENSKNYYF